MTETTKYKGTCKFFDAQKGWGYLAREGQSDLFVHYSALQMEGFKKLRQDDEVEFDVVPGKKPGQEQAANVVITKPAEVDGEKGDGDGGTEDTGEETS